MAGQISIGRVLSVSISLVRVQLRLGVRGRARGLPTAAAPDRHRVGPISNRRITRTISQLTGIRLACALDRPRCRHRQATSTVYNNSTHRPRSSQPSPRALAHVPPRRLFRCSTEPERVRGYHVARLSPSDGGGRVYDEYEGLVEHAGEPVVVLGVDHPSRRWRGLAVGNLRYNGRTVSSVVRKRKECRL